MLPRVDPAPDSPGAWAAVGRHPAPRMEAQQREQRDVGPPGVSVTWQVWKGPDRPCSHCLAPDEDTKTQLGSRQCCPGHWTGRAGRSRTRAPLAWPRDPEG